MPERPSLEIIDPLYYEHHGYPHDAWTHLRAHEPVSWWEPVGMPPFWAITRHADIERISREPERFLSSPMLAIFPRQQFDPENFPLRAMTKMDPPEHGEYRGLTSHWFTARSVERWRSPIDSIVEERLALAGERGDVDFVTEVAAVVSIFVIAEILGIPRSDWQQLFRWTNQTMGATDPEFQSEAGSVRHGSLPMKAIKGDEESYWASVKETEAAALRQQFEYFSRLIESRRREPADDVTSLLAHARLAGKPLPDWELLSYVIVLMIAGNDTTRNAMSGGLLALIEHPGALARLRQEPTLLPLAIEEMLRWTSPVVQFCRTPAADVEIGGTKVRAGETLCLFYPSGNRDERVFDRPFEFRIDRQPNPHVAFGVGEHFCLGAHLARLELTVLFARLLDRFDAIELRGPVARLRSSFVGGIKHLPVRLRSR
jgi:cholest-4-en-3-one 26-monooxygenase